MPNQTLSALTSASALTGTELFYTVQGGADRKVTSSQIYTYVTTVSTFGGVTASSAPPHQFANQITAAGALLYQQPAFSDISGVAASSQVGLGPFTAGQIIYASSTTTADGIAGSVWSSSVNTLSLQTNTLTFASTTGTERVRVDSIGNVTIGANSSNIPIQATDVRLEVVTDASPWQLGVITTGNTAGVGGWVYAKTRGTVGSSQVIVQSSDRMLLLEAAGSDGVTYQNAARIQSWVDGVPGVNSMPGRWTFETTPSGSITTTERMRIASGGEVVIGGIAPQAVFGGANSPSLQVHGLSQVVGFARYSPGLACRIWVAHSNAGTVGVQTTLGVNDGIASFNYAGSDGTSFVQAASLEVQVDATVSAGVMPGRMLFNINNTAGSAVERARIDVTGNTWLMNTTAASSVTPSGAKANINGIAANFAHASYGGI